MTEGQAINILKRVIEYLSGYRPFDREQDQQDALEIANTAIESLFQSAKGVH